MAQLPEQLGHEFADFKLVQRDYLIVNDRPVGRIVFFFHICLISCVLLVRCVVVQGPPVRALPPVALIRRRGPLARDSDDPPLAQLVAKT